MLNEFQRGSEWRRWDLHLHTPGTNKNDRFEGDSLKTKWDKFYEDIASYIGDGSNGVRDIAVVGITDYLSIDNYMKVVSDDKLPKSVYLVLPDVEMRIQPISRKSATNIHFIFNPLIVSSLQDRFFAKLSLDDNDTAFSAARSELMRLGKANDSSLDDERAYREGIEQFIPSSSNVISLFKGDDELRENTLIFISNSNKDGVSGITSHYEYLNEATSRSQLKTSREILYRFADGVFSASPQDIEYFSGERAGCPSEEVTERCGSLKPCIHGCDAHDNNRIFEPDNQRYCWIKADPTFNGLKQIVYEPSERVKISETMPNYKSAYYVIDHVEFRDNDFQDDPILFSDQLTCIIGGKSTGKSILLHNLASSIDEEQVEENERISETATKHVDEVAVFWGDGKSNEKRKIIYVPQSYINRISDERNTKTEIDSLIEEIILIDHSLSKAYSEMQSSINGYKADLNKKIMDLLKTNKRLDELAAENKELGDKAAIEAQICDLKTQREITSKELAVTADVMSRYDNALQEINFTSKLIEETNSEKEYLDRIDSIVQMRNIDYSFSETTKIAIDEAAKTAILSADKAWTDSKRKIVGDLENEICGERKTLSESQKIERELKPLVERNKAIAELTLRLEDENEKLQRSLRIEREFKKAEKEKQKCMEVIASSKDFFFGQHESFADLVNKSLEHQEAELEFSVCTPFKCEDFVSKLGSLFNINTRTFKEVIKPAEFTSDSYTESKLLEIIERVLNSDLTLKGGNTIEMALRDIFDDWYSTKYNVKMDDDMIATMSPGKKALVILRLLIDLAESKCPILIDQPEDDLDNRSIYNDLIPFIRRKKKERQIIVVTHNANVVLGADAEEIIVANQEGSDAKNWKKRFEYRSGSIENDQPRFEGDNGKPVDGVLNSCGIQQHICDILEGGEKAFELRKQKYHI